MYNFTTYLAFALVLFTRMGFEPPVELGMCWLLATAMVVAAVVSCSFSPVVSLNKTQLLYLCADSFAPASTLHGVLLAPAPVFAIASTHAAAAPNPSTSKFPGSRRRPPSPHRLRNCTFWNRGMSSRLLRHRLKLYLWADGAMLPSSSTFAS
ncbi:unnamed protein product [Urochloa humidicola]